MCWAFGSIHVYVKVEEKCQKALCNYQKCSCHLPCHYFAIVEVLDKDDEQLPTYRGRTVVTHITKVKTSNRYSTAMPYHLLWGHVCKHLTNWGQFFKHLSCYWSWVLSSADNFDNIMSIFMINYRINQWKIDITFFPNWLPNYSLLLVVTSNRL